MKNIDEIKDLIQKNKEDLRRQFGVSEIGIFGSYVTGKQTEDSDLDILIQLEKPIGFVRFMKLERRLTELAGIRVELVTKMALKPFIGQRILQEVMYV